MISNFDKKAAEILAGKSNFIFDIDGCLYSRDKSAGGYYQQLSHNIKKAFKNAVLNRGEFKGALKIGIDTVLSKPQYLSAIFSSIAKGAKEIIISKITGKEDSFDKVEEVYKSIAPLIKIAQDKYPEEIFNYANSMYGDSYHLIKHDNDFISASRDILNKGNKINFYTNSPSYAENGKYAHTQKVLLALGFTEQEVDDFRALTYGMSNALSSGTIGKPSREDMQDFIKFAEIENTDKAVMFDDSIANLKTAADFGIQPVWVWTDSKAPSEKDVEIAKSIDAIIINDVGKVLPKIVSRM